MQKYKNATVAAKAGFDFTPHGLPAPTMALPGSWAKVEELRRRYDEGLELSNPEDVCAGTDKFRMKDIPFSYFTIVETEDKIGFSDDATALQPDFWLPKAQLGMFVFKDGKSGFGHRRGVRLVRIRITKNLADNLAGRVAA